MLKDLLEHIVRKLVDKPENISVTEIDSEQVIVLELRVAKEDLGKVIGKEGKTARSIRTLVNAVAVKQGKRATLEILE